MMKNAKMMRTMGITLTLMFCASLLMFSSAVEAKSKVVAVEGVSYNVNASITENLKSLISKKVCVTLNSGKIFYGFVKDVGNHLIHLEKLDGKDYFDALILIEDISAIDTKFRNIQR